MTPDPSEPSLAEFLALSPEQIAPLAPSTVIYAAGGTRRQAVLAGIDPRDPQAWARWGLEQQIACCALLFQHGVHHIVTHALVPSQLQEVGPYRAQLLELAAYIGGSEARAQYIRRGWRVRLVGTEDLPELHPTAARLQAETLTDSRYTVWWTVTPTHEALWRRILAAGAAGARTQAEAIALVYGAAIPPATLLLATGKPIAAPDLLPPLLMGQMQCYWSQRPGYSLTTPELRAILYDYAYRRATWREDKTGRADAALVYQSTLEQSRILGLGRRLGPFWYPTDGALAEN
ncbi:MAG TPA: hypothetical protein VKY74_21540 [Chloroflexia bacterium]|nr:hypothetical protein [Chloroflexia bacterium]